MRRVVAVLFVMGMLGLTIAAAAEGISVGGTVVFGRYPQGSSGEIEPIEWIVLDVDEDGCYVLISRFALDARQYHGYYTDVTWQRSDIREWLNGEFLRRAFTEDEQEMITVATVTADRNPSWTFGGHPGSDTEDRVYLLSMVEAQRYFKTSEARVCVPTDYVMSLGVETSGPEILDGKAGCFWLLRTPGVSQDLVCKVQPSGRIFDSGSPVLLPSHLKKPCIRPVIRVMFD